MMNLRTRLGLALLPLGGLTFLATGANAGTLSPNDYVHRGECGTYTENSKYTWRCLLRNHPGLGLEGDVRFTRTGIPVIMHDPTVGRTTRCSGYVSRLSWPQIGMCRLNDGSELPSLGSFASYVRTYNAWALIEFKVMPKGAQWAKVYDLLDPIRDRIIIYAFKGHENITLEFKRRGWRTAKYHLPGDGYSSWSTVKKYGNYYLATGAPDSVKSSLKAHGIKTIGLIGRVS